MAEHESGQERTEEPTPKRQEDAKKKGQLARSRELNTMISLLVGAGGLIAFGNTMIGELSEQMKNYLTMSPAGMDDIEVFTATVGSALGNGILICVPFFMLLLVSVFVGPLAMGGWAFSPSSMAFKISKLNPLKGVAKMVSAKSLMELVKALGKFLLVGAMATTVIWQTFDQLLMLASKDVETALNHFANIAGLSFLSFCTALILIAAIDVPFQLWEHKRQLKMTKQEIKDESKESEGRPEVKSQIRMLQREMSQRRMMDNVPTANVVITNPTHYAVALKYDDLGSRAPVVVAKGKGEIAMRIRKLAAEHDVMSFSAPPLARAIYASTEIDREIPAQLYLAVAQVLAYVYQLKLPPVPGQPVPQPPTDIAIPDELSVPEDNSGDSP
ncbi:MAG: flagellar biosynthesis protein FlhB [Gammaproteobacteria bacterium]|nr:flagellar biosynthesis protein FlhB [Gammaproteobacteria bacterium]MBQ0839538.1 flagellar biosynthesis protein FlhB [Gammaproteobacteria bacterium]